MRNIISAVCAPAITLILTACQTPQTRPPGERPAADPLLAIDTLHPEPAGFLAALVDSPDYPIPPYARFLAGAKVCLDPGHGGNAHKRGFKRGPTGVREAEVNLRVARYLRALLQHVGAEVLLTREHDIDISLADRAAVANQWHADLFISLHHNAVDDKPHVNFTTVWYHADVDHRPANLDLARYLCYGLYEALALPQITDAPLKSDQLMYESGFGVLRNAQVTAALTETSFFTNPEEEQRLRDPEYNFLEAYGLFLGLARYAAAGLPRATLLDPDALPPERGEQSTGAPPFEDGERSANEEPRKQIAPLSLLLELDDGLRKRKAWGHDRQMILRDTIAVRLDDQPALFTFNDDGQRYLVEVELPPGLPPGPHTLEVQFQNMNKNSVLNPVFKFEIE